MSTVIKPKRTEVAAKVPTTSDIAVGEIAMNLTDGKMYSRKSDNSIVEVGGAGRLRITQDIQLNGSDIIFEVLETTLTVAEPTLDRTITLPNVTGTVITFNRI